MVTVPNSSPSDTQAVHLSTRCLHEYADMGAALQAAHTVAASTGAIIYACTVFSQAGRVIVASSFPLSSLRTRLKTQSATKGDDPRTMQNRPVDTDHVVSIRDYLVQNYPNYVLPALSVTYREEIGIYTTSVGKVRQGYVVIPDGLTAFITDGQHRYLALTGIKNAKPEIEGALDRVSTLGNDAIGVLITIEDNLQRIHQDFADMAMTKPLPKSLLTAYDLRDPINRLVYEVVSRSPLFKGRVDETSKTLSKKSKHVALANWMRNLVKGAIAPDYFVAEADMHRYEEELLDPAELTNLQNELVFLVEEMTANIGPLKRIAQIPPKSPEANQVPEILDPVLATMGVGLGISGMVLRRIRTHVKEPVRRRELIRDLFTKVNWLRKDPSDPSFEPDTVWTHGGVLDAKGKISSTRGNIFTSTARILQRLGIPVEARLQRAIADEDSTLQVADA